MNNREAYNAWSGTYDTVVNKTRDMEGVALRTLLSADHFNNVLEIGCGTGKNTEWLLTKTASLVGADFSEEMLTKAREKITAENVRFVQMDIRREWPFENGTFDIVTFSLVLEHIENIDFIFSEVRRVLRPGGRVYLGELHPFKQYTGSKARFETGDGVFELECFVYHVSDYFQAARRQQLTHDDVREWFDGDDNTVPPRLLTMLFQAPA